MTPINCAEIATGNNLDEGYPAGVRLWIAMIVAPLEQINHDFLPRRNSDFDGIGARALEKLAISA
ncbi:hypothetical protein [uncultured Roseibium sp.]|uniref:hypothetical protein n=1 Tax=uncultured Roseibium sp. TaxID=1936171 RepID=UPI0026298000|nr:hypothetical protein [uncultured Roseibium sp.]